MYSVHELCTELHLNRERVGPNASHQGLKSLVVQLILDIVSFYVFLGKQ